MGDIFELATCRRQNDSFILSREVYRNGECLIHKIFMISHHTRYQYLSKSNKL